MSEPINIPTLTILSADVALGFDGTPAIRLLTKEVPQIVLVADAAARLALRDAINNLETAFSPPQGRA